MNPTSSDGTPPPPTGDAAPAWHSPSPHWPDEQLNRPAYAAFARWAAIQPERVAVIEHDSGRRWRYGELARWAQAIAAALDGPADAPVAVLLPAGGALAAAFLGALAAGRPYVPLDPGFPLERNRLILAQSGAQDLLCLKDGPAWPAQPGDPPLRTLWLDALADTAQPPESRQPPQRPRPPHPAAPPEPPEPPEPPDRPLATAPPDPAATDDPTRPERIAYILYTSGSTGTPKGVFQNQRGLLHDISQYAHMAQLGPQDVLSWLYSPSVNGAIRDVYAALFHGAALVALEARALGLHALRAAVARQRISVLHAIPPLLRALLRGPAPADWLDSVRLVYVAGDRFFASDLALLRQQLPAGACIYNGIGSTECATLYRHWMVDERPLAADGLVPVGQAIPQRETRLLDADGQPVAPGAPGEVEVCSPFLARGYWRQPELTARHFRPDPQRPGWQRLRTGDLARERPDGLLDYLGRADGQVKVRGYRIELGAVEAALRQLPGVEDAAALLLTPPGADPVLHAWLVGTPPGTGEPSVREQLACQLPGSHLPAHIHWLDQLPRLPNYKLDPVALRQQTQPNPEAPPPAPNNPATPDEIERCWLEALHRSTPVAATERFSDLGGDSLAALNLLAALETQLGRQLDPQCVHPAQTLAGLRHQLAAPQRRPRRVLFVIAGLNNGYPGLLDLAQHLATVAPDIHLHRVQLAALNALDRPGQPAQPSRPAQAAQPAEAAQPGPSARMTPPALADLGATALAHEAAGHILAAQHTLGLADEPVHLLGLSFGGRLAFETAQRLAAQGQRVGSLSVGDLGPLWPDARHMHLRWPAALRPWRWRLGLGWQLLHDPQRPSWAERLAHVRSRWRSQRVAAAWRPGHWPGTLHLLRASLEPWREHLPTDLGWQAHADRVVVHDLPCRHVELLAPAQLAQVGDILRRQMAPAADG